MTAPTRFILVDDNEADNVFHEIMSHRAGFDGELLIYEEAAEALDLSSHARPRPC